MGHNHLIITSSPNSEPYNPNPSANNRDRNININPLLLYTLGVTRGQMSAMVLFAGQVSGKGANVLSRRPSDSLTVFQRHQSVLLAACATTPTKRGDRKRWGEGAGWSRGVMDKDCRQTDRQTDRQQVLLELAANANCVRNVSLNRCVAFSNSSTICPTTINYQLIAPLVMHKISTADRI